jgi:hypothetical protein
MEEGELPLAAVVPVVEQAELPLAAVAPARRALCGHRRRR